ncbi:MAG: aminotransferase class I/II-fold pyridoxal phosphate-dependent enzyme [Clostridium sp.]
MYSFTNDYSEGAHPRILDALIQANLEQNIGYGLDDHCLHAAELIKKECNCNNIDVHFLVGGTQTNMTAIAYALRPFQAVISAATGHINVHETGAVEASGHKVFTIPCEDGKLTVDKIQKALSFHQDEHFVQPKMVYISNTTELGTQYTKEELEKISHFCHLNGLYLFLDGARLGAALTSSVNDLTMADLAALTDLFYIGGTKNGALFGEALVIRNDELKKDFRFMIKQRGAMLAKGFTLGIQFETLFTDGLFYELAEHANRMADLLRDAIIQCGIPFLSPSNSNQLFPIIKEEQVEKLAQKYTFNIERDLEDGTQAIRLVTSWATKETAVIEFIDDFKHIIES